MAARARLVVVVLASALVAAPRSTRARTTRPRSRSSTPGNATARGTSRRFVSRHPPRARTRRDAVLREDGGRRRLFIFAAVPARSRETREAREEKRVHKKKCAPMKHPAEERCAYVESHQRASATTPSVHYLRSHFLRARVRPKTRRAEPIPRRRGARALCAVLGTVADRFFRPALVNIARWLELSDDVAGTTLLFGNGSPDVFAQIAALSDARAEGVSLGVGAALGSTFFVASAVLPLVVLCAKDAKEGVRVDAASFVRDGAFYLAAVVSVAGVLAGDRFSPRRRRAHFPLPENSSARCCRSGGSGCC